MTDELIHPEVLRLIQLFSALPDVRFPDVEAGALHELVARVKERHLEVVQLEAQAEAARRVLEDEQEQLLKKTHRLHAWLAVLAQGDEALSERLAVIDLPRVRKAVKDAVPESGDAPAPKKRGRPRKVVPSTEVLFAEAAVAS